MAKVLYHTEVNAATTAFFARHKEDLRNYAASAPTLTVHPDGQATLDVRFYLDTKTTAEFLTLGNAEIKEG